MKLTYKGLTSFQIQTSSIEESKELVKFLVSIKETNYLCTEQASNIPCIRVYVRDGKQCGWDYEQNSRRGLPVISCGDFMKSLTIDQPLNKEQKPITSDGGSSDYYKQPIPKGMLERWTAEGIIEAKDIMKLFLNNDYNFSNSFKAHCRVVSLRNGVGKEGASESYDLRKGWFFAEDAYKDHLERSGE